MSEERPASPGQTITADQIKRWGPTWSRRVGTMLAKGVWNTRVVGAERVPRTGRLLVAANHTGIIDGPLLHGVIPRESHMIIKEEMFSGVIGFLMRGAGQIPVDRRNGRAALQTALTLLQEDRLVGVFPEGTRGGGDVKQTKAGIAWLAVRSGAPVLPVAILGTRPAGKKPGYIPGFRGRLLVEFGEPFVAVDPGAGVGRAAVTEAMGRIQQELGAHVHGASERHDIPLPRSTEI
ncbi:1-acyl-sn-glycerol-3-phosphate acyltransferase [Ruania suaedae]|uniref:lysophospholipid acyltransferase family protein n=1 Tax=Ruania suaedae TaxID=2897774 RepID=UPI001E4A8FA6|nr:lysophospholipid acyltransferase family protein [Ruania suaedae]UFU04459.1 1-acyl-sn-glycerol-3-phosphate acyltransferase [Ruania suaedae]